MKIAANGAKNVMINYSICRTKQKLFKSLSRVGLAGLWLEWETRELFLGFCMGHLFGKTPVGEQYRLQGLGFRREDEPNRLQIGYDGKIGCRGFGLSSPLLLMSQLVKRNKRAKDLKMNALSKEFSMNE